MFALTLALGHWKGPLGLWATGIGPLGIVPLALTSGHWHWAIGIGSLATMNIKKSLSLGEQFID